MLSVPNGSCLKQGALELRGNHHVLQRSKLSILRVCTQVIQNEDDKELYNVAIKIGTYFMEQFYRKKI